MKRSTPFVLTFALGASQASFCAQTTQTMRLTNDIVCSVVVANVAKVAEPQMQYYWLIQQSKTSPATQLKIRKPLKCQPLHRKLKPLSAPVSCRTSPVNKPHILKKYSPSVSASPASFPLKSPRQITSPSIKPLSLMSQQAKSMPPLVLPMTTIAASAQKEGPQTPQKRTLARITSFSQSSSSTNSTSAPTT